VTEELKYSLDLAEAINREISTMGRVWYLIPLLASFVTCQTPTTAPTVNTRAICYAGWLKCCGSALHSTTETGIACVIE
jgi:hypothetical protein